MRRVTVRRALRSRTCRRAALGALAVFGLQPSAGYAHPLVAPHATRSIVGGDRIAIGAAPWQVDVWSEDRSTVSDCGGAILSPTTVLTAAHCVEGTTPGNAPRDGGLAVWAGTSSVNANTASTSDRLHLQERRVASARVHPQWRGRVTSAGDLAVLTLATPLQLDGKRVAAIALPAELAVPTVGSMLVAPALTVSGYGLTAAGAQGTSDGRLRQLRVDVVDSDRCGDDDNAVELCAASAAGSACSGDSGGPVVAPGPTLVGIVSNGPRACPPNGANRYVNLAVPENRAFVLGDDDPPVAPRVRSPARFVGATDVLRVGQRLTCDGGTFAGDQHATTAVSTADGTTVLQATGRTAELGLTSDLVGRTLRCRGYGANAGGIAASNLAVAESAVRAAAAPGTTCASRRTAVPVRIAVPARVAAGAAVRVVARIDEPAPDARAALMVVKRTAAGSGSVRTVTTIAVGAHAATAQLMVRVPRSLSVGSRASFQAVFATYASRAAARSGADLADACDAGDATFSLRIARSRSARAAAVRHG